MRDCWRLDEVTPAGRENFDADHVAHYDDRQDAVAIDEIEMLRCFGLDERPVAVDLGAGTGQFTVATAPVCATVVAVDSSPVMVQEPHATSAC